MSEHQLRRFDARELAGAQVDFRRQGFPDAGGQLRRRVRFERCPGKCGDGFHGGDLHGAFGVKDAGGGAGRDNRQQRDARIRRIPEQPCDGFRKLRRGPLCFERRAGFRGVGEGRSGVQRRFERRCSRLLIEPARALKPELIAAYGEERSAAA